MQKQRIKTRVVDCWRSPCVRATLPGGGAANRPAQVFDPADMEQVDAGCKYFLLPKSGGETKLWK
jgi:hypothetical protein